MSFDYIDLATADPNVFEGAIYARRSGKVTIAAYRYLMGQIRIHVMIDVRGLWWPDIASPEC